MQPDKTICDPAPQEPRHVDGEGVAHTPGPWKNARVRSSGGWHHVVETGAGVIVCRVYDIAASEANARLIAASPTMAQELAWIAVFAEMRAGDDSKTFARVNRGALRTIAEKARAALAKARGEQP